MKLWLSIVLFLFFTIHSMEQSVDIVNSKQKKQLTEEQKFNIWRYWYKHLGNPVHRNLAQEIIQLSLNDNIKRYILAKTIAHAINHAPICYIPPNWKKCWISSNFKKALFYYGKDQNVKRKLVLYDIDTGEQRILLKHLIEHYNFDSFYVQFSSDNKYIVVIISSKDTFYPMTQIFLIEVENGEEVNFSSISEHTAVAFLHETFNHILLLTKNYQLIILDSLTGKEIHHYDLQDELLEHYTPTEEPAFFCIPHPQQSLVFIGGKGKKILFDYEKNKVLFRNGNPISYWYGKWSPDGKNFIYMNECWLEKPSTIHLFDLEKNKFIRSWDCSKGFWFGWASSDMIYFISSLDCEKTEKDTIGLINIHNNKILYSEFILEQTVAHYSKKSLFVRTHPTDDSLLEAAYAVLQQLKTTLYSETYNSIPDQFKNMSDYLNGLSSKNNESSLTFDQMLLLNAISKKTKLDNEGFFARTLLYALDKASYKIFISLPKPIQYRLMPLVEMHSFAYYKTTNIIDGITQRFEALGIE